MMSLTRKRLAPIALPLIVALTACFSSKNPDITGPAGDCRFSSSSGVPGTTVVAIRNQAFAPVEIRIRAGGTVTWVNCEEAGAEAHTSTADQGQWSSVSLASGDVFSHTFPQPGVFSYHCTPHPFMTASVVVE